MKGKTFFLVCIILAFSIIGAFAAVGITENIKFSKLSKFDKMVVKMNESIKDDSKFNNALINYKYLEKGYKVGSEKMDYFADLIIDGYDAEEVIRCAYFWLDTDETTAVVKQMCDWKSKGGPATQSEFWAENAFNAVTKNKCGVLTEEDFEEYAKRGITDSDIMTANRLCRKGVYTIQDILDKFEKGTAMADIAVEIDRKAPFLKHTENKLLSSDKSLKSPKAELKMTKVDDNEIFESRHLAMLKNAPEQAFRKSEGDNVDIAAQLETESRRVTDEIVKELNKGNYLRKKGAKQ